MRRFFALFAVLAALFVTRAASAQAVINIVNEASLPRYNTEGKLLQKRTTNLSPEAVSLQDCVDDQRIRFSFTNSGYEANAQIQSWASITGDCKAATARAGAVATCWQIGANIALQPNPSIDIPVRNIMSGVGKVTAPDPSVAICGAVDLATINVQFLYFAPGATAGDATSVKAVPVIVDTVGPSPPSGLTVKPGNTRIHVSWTSISGTASDASTSTGNSGTGLTELTGIKIYCAQNDATGSTGSTDLDASCAEVANPALDDGGDAGSTIVCADASTGADASTPNTATCASSSFVNADGTSKLPDNAFNNLFECGSLSGNTGSSVTATAVGGRDLVNGQTYAVALAATDKYGNVGPLSSVVCERPEPTTDFWESYRDAGGDGGGGCSTVAPSVSPLGTLVTLGIAVVAAATSIFRRRRNGSSR